MADLTIEELQGFNDIQRGIIERQQAEIERLRADNDVLDDEAAKAINGLRDAKREIERLRELLRDARDEVAECANREWKPHRIEAYKKQLAEIDEALGE